MARTGWLMASAAGPWLGHGCMSQDHPGMLERALRADANCTGIKRMARLLRPLYFFSHSLCCYYCYYNLCWLLLPLLPPPPLLLPGTLAATTKERHHTPATANAAATNTSTPRPPGSQSRQHPEYLGSSSLGVAERGGGTGVWGGGGG